MENDNDIQHITLKFTAHLLDEDMLEFLSNCKKGLFQFEIGVQTTNQKALMHWKKRWFGKLSCSKK